VPRPPLAGGVHAERDARQRARAGVLATRASGARGSRGG
jgi:hypothetical protein